jgi:hypothetical protein
MNDPNTPQIASTTPYQLSDKDWERFNSKIEVDKNTGCAVWTGSTRDGYGTFNLSGKPVSAHRVAYFAKYPDTDPALSIRHTSTCSNRACVNVEHMVVGSPKWQGKKHPVKLSQDDLTDITNELAQPYRGQIMDLARKYGVSHSYISHIKKNFLLAPRPFI